MPDYKQGKMYTVRCKTDDTLIYTLVVQLNLIVGNGPQGVQFFPTGVLRRKYKLGQTKQI